MMSDLPTGCSVERPRSNRTRDRGDILIGRPAMKATMGKAHSMRGFFARRTAQLLDTPPPAVKMSRVRAKS
jgi:hypothetical protein